MGVNERRAITPLFWGHVNPYGTFQLDMTARLAFRAVYVGRPRNPVTPTWYLTIRGHPLLCAW
jgi:hypothetical protein